MLRNDGTNIINTPHLVDAWQRFTCSVTTLIPVTCMGRLAPQYMQKKTDTFTNFFLKMIRPGIMCV